MKGSKFYYLESSYSKNQRVSSIAILGDAVEVPIYPIYFNNNVIIYFDTEKISPLKLGKYYLVIKSNERLGKIDYDLNKEKITPMLIKQPIKKDGIKDLVYNRSARLPSLDFSSYVTGGYKTSLDITLIVHKIVTGLEDNNGLVLNIENIQPGSLNFSLRSDPYYKLMESRFYEEMLILSTELGELVTKGYRVSDYAVVSVFIKNYSRGMLRFTLESSPNNIDFIPQNSQEIGISEIGVTFPNIFAKFIRIRMEPENPPLVVEFWFQGQKNK